MAKQRNHKHSKMPSHFIEKCVLVDAVVDILYHGGGGGSPKGIYRIRDARTGRLFAVDEYWKPHAWKHALMELLEARRLNTDLDDLAKRFAMANPGAGVTFSR